MKLKSIITVIALTATAVSGTHAQTWKNSLKKSKAGSFPQLQPVQLTYEASWSNIVKSGKVSFIFGKKDRRYPNYYISQAYGGSILNRLPYNFDMTSFSKKKSLRPVLLIANEKDKKEVDVTTNKYKKTSVSHRKVTNKIGSSHKKTKKHTFSASSIHDPLTAMLFIRSQKLNNGDKINLCIHPFSSPYYGTVTVLGRELHLGKPSIKLDVALSKINLSNGSLGNYSKLKKATIWLSDDKFRIPLEFRLKVSLKKYINLGDVRLVLKARQKP